MTALQGAPVRIAVSGTPGVGKTSLVERVRRALSPNMDVAVSTDVARTLAREGVRINTESQLEDYIAFLVTHTRNMRLLKGHLILLDQTILDVLAFMEFNGDATGWLRSLAEELVEWQMPLISAYFYIPPEFDVADDGVRIVGQPAIRALDDSIQRLLERHRPDFVTLTGTPSEQLEKVLDAIRHLVRP